MLIIGQPAFANTALPLRDMLPIAKTSPHPPPDPAVQPSCQAEDTPELSDPLFWGGSVSSVAFSPDGNFAVIGGVAAVASLIDLRTGAIVRSFGGHTYDEVKAVAFSPDGRHILTGSLGTIAHLWNVTTGATLIPLRVLLMPLQSPSRPMAATF